MSESTDVNREQPSAPRRSRREQRQAERAAEREAYLTGQQPLLTRREMRRLREEAEALRAAIAAGEITEEQAQALQDPTLAGESMAVLAGVPAVSGPAGPVVIPDLDDAPAGEGSDDAAPLLGGAAVGQQGAARYSSEEMTAIAALETGVMGALDLAAAPAGDESVDAAPGQAAESSTGGAGAVDPGAAGTGVEEAEEARPAVPERRSLFGAVALQDAPSHPQTPSLPEDVTRPDDAEQTPASGLPAGAGDLLEDAEPAESTATVGDQEPDAEAADEDTASPSPSTPARRPIVRIPATVQGVRTVDLDTGELSAVQPVDDAFSGIENPQWKALRDTAAPAGAAEEAPASAATPEQAAEPEETADPQPAEEVDEALEEIAAPVEEQGRRGMARTLLIALVVLVVVLVLATIVWFVLVRNGNVFAARTLLASLEALII